MMTFDDDIAILTLGSPDGAASLDTDTARALTAATADVLAREGVRGLILTHTGDALARGADPAHTPAARFDSRVAWHRLTRSWETADKPVALVLTGSAHDGAADLFLSGHQRFVGPGAHVDWPGLLRGRWDGLGASQRLPRRLGLQAGLMAMLTPGGHDAEALAGAGLAQRGDDPLAAAKAWIHSGPEIADPFPPRGFRWPKPAPVTPGAQQLLLAAQAQIANTFPPGHMVEQWLTAAAEGAPIVLDRALEVEARVWTAAAKP